MAKLHARNHNMQVLKHLYLLQYLLLMLRNWKTINAATLTFTLV